MKLTARYMLEFPDGIRVRRADEQDFVFGTTHGEYSTKVELRFIEPGPHAVYSDDHPPLWIVNAVCIEVTRDHAEPPPEPTDGGRNLRAPSEWLDSVEPGYREAATTLANRLVRFFKYKLQTPGLREYRNSDPTFHNPKWVDEGGRQLRGGAIRLVSRVPHESGHRQLLSELDFADERAKELEDALRAELDIGTAREFLSDAQNSIRSRDFRRAVLELAIACEVEVKQLFFSRDTIAGTAHKYLADQHKRRVRVTELLDEVANHAFGESYKEIDRKGFCEIERLFEARNKVAHRGLAIVRDNEGSEHSIDQDILIDWWHSVQQLFRWTNEQKRKLS